MRRALIMLRWIVFTSTTKPGAAWRAAVPAHARRAERPAHGGHRGIDARISARGGRRRPRGSGDQAVFGAADAHAAGRAARILLDHLTSGLRTKWPLINKLFERAQQSIPGGVNSPVRAFRSVGVHAPLIARATGRNFWDVGGQALHRLHRLVGPDDCWPWSSASCARVQSAAALGLSTAPNRS